MIQSIAEPRAAAAECKQAPGYSDSSSQWRVPRGRQTASLTPIPLHPRARLLTFGLCLLLLRLGGLVQLAARLRRGRLLTTSIITACGRERRDGHSGTDSIQRLSEGRPTHFNDYSNLVNFVFNVYNISSIVTLTYLLSYIIFRDISGHFQKSFLDDPLGVAWNQSGVEPHWCGT